ncbi:MAG: hypothetical protein ACI9OJ_004060 [Myxococcota bacterium]
MAVMPDPARTVSNDRVSCPAPSRIKNRNGCRVPSDMVRLRAAWVVQGPVGLVVIPARCTLRVECSMTKSTCNRLSNTVSIQAKSVARIPLACELMNWDHVGPVRCRVNPGGFEDLPDRRRGDGVSQTLEFSVDAPVSPVGVLTGHPSDQPPEVWVDGWAASRFVRWLGPVSADSLFVPSQNCFGFDNQKRVVSACPRHCRPEKGEDRAVGVGEVWSVDLAL